MAFQFPASPVLGQTFTPVAGVGYKWNGTGWSPLGPQSATLNPDGTLGAPGISWANEPTSGFYRPAANTMYYAIGGAYAFAVTPTGFTVQRPIVAVGGPVYHSDGTLALPGINWANETNSGFQRYSANTFQSIVNGASAWSWSATSFYIPSTTTFIADGPSNFYQPVSIAGAGTLSVNGQSYFEQMLSITHGYGGDWSEWAGCHFRLQNSAGGVAPGIVMYETGYAIWTIVAKLGSLLFGANGGGGPVNMGRWAMTVTTNGTVNARSFNQQTFAATNVAPMTGALSDVLKLRGVRCLNTETNLPDIRLEVDELELAFPEAVSATEAGKGINYAALAAPIIEAIRELHARVTALENP